MAGPGRAGEAAIAPPEALNQALTARAFDAVLTRSPPVTSWDLGDSWHSRGVNNVTGLSNRRLDLLVEALMQDFDRRPGRDECEGSRSPHSGQPSRAAAAAHARNRQPAARARRH